MAEKVLIMTVPCHRAFLARVVWSLDTNRAFPEFFAKPQKSPKMVSSPRHIVSSRGSGRNKTGSPERRGQVKTSSMADRINRPADGFGHNPSAHFPKFVLNRGTHRHELRKVMGASKPMILGPLFLFDVP
jgi:hypothetical protein